MIERLSIPKAARIPVFILGEWSPDPKRDWRGVASSTEPIVAVSFLRCGRHVEWCISERPKDVTLEVRIALFPLSKSELDVQVNVSLGNTSRRWTMIVESSSYRPIVPNGKHIHTGEVISLARVEGKQPVDFLGLFLRKSDTKCGRKGIWHLRPELLEEVHPNLMEVLTRGRTGAFEDDYPDEC